MRSDECVKLRLVMMRLSGRRARNAMMRLTDAAAVKRDGVCAMPQQKYAAATGYECIGDLFHAIKKRAMPAFLYAQTANFAMPQRGLPIFHPTFTEVRYRIFHCPPIMKIRPKSAE